MNLARRSALLIGVLLFSTHPAGAHDSPAHVVEALTARIAQNGSDTRLLMSRAYEYQSLGRWDDAVADLEIVLRMNPHSQEATAALVETFLHQDAPTKAEQIARHSLESNAVDERMHALLAAALMSQDRWDEALPAWREALKIAKPEIAWFLGEAECLRRLGLYPEQVTALEQARTRNPSIVLHRVWIRALIDAGSIDDAFGEIEKGLADARWRSSWLLLRARCQERNGRSQAQVPVSAAQYADARDAFLEIQTRLNSGHPDPQLTADLAESLTLMGRRELATKFLDHVEQFGSPNVALGALKNSVQPGLVP